MRAQQYARTGYSSSQQYTLSSQSTRCCCTSTLDCCKPPEEATLSVPTLSLARVDSTPPPSVLAACSVSHLSPVDACCTNMFRQILLSCRQHARQEGTGARSMMAGVAHGSTMVRHRARWLLALAFALGLDGGPRLGLACTTIGVGKDASADGSTMTTHNADVRRELMYV